MLVLALEAFAALRALVRMARTAGGTPLRPAPQRDPSLAIDAILPVLDEEDRLGDALAALARCGPELRAIVVVDGGSRDATPSVVATAAARDPRVRWCDAGSPPPGWNGKAWNLEVGLGATSASWIATIDADVRAGATVLADALARARDDDLAALSIATRQELPDVLSALLHPALLATLVYRLGLPNVASTDPRTVQANGQLFIARRDALVAAGAFRIARASRCEDVTIARALAATGARVGFFEGDAVVRMYASWRACAESWPRSLTLQDGFVTPLAVASALAGVALAQALPLPTLLLARTLRARALAAALVAVRLGVLAGMRRAYVRPSPAYWLSPLADLPALALLLASAARRTHRWRGRILVTEDG
jgi:dolichol-phosphate mannosyltransferase